VVGTLLLFLLACLDSNKYILGRTTFFAILNYFNPYIKQKSCDRKSRKNNTRNPVCILWYMEDWNL